MPQDLSLPHTAAWVAEENSKEMTSANDRDSNGGSDLDPETVAELRRLARLRPWSGREAVAKASALRTLERSRRGEASGAADA